MTHLTGTGTVGDDDKVVAVYWFGNADHPKQFGVCFPGAVFNIARQSIAESLTLANDVLTDAIDGQDAEVRR